MPGNIRLWGTTGYVELAAPATGNNATLTLPTDSIQPGLSLIVNQSFIATSSVSVNNCFTNNYDNYRIIISGVGGYTGSGVNGGVFRLRSSGTDISTSDYSWSNIYSTSTAGPSRSWASASSYWYFFMFDHQNINILDLYTPSGSTKKSGSMTYNASGTVDAVNGVAGLANYTSRSVDGISIASYSGTMSGNIRVYGYRNSTTA